MKKWTLPSVVLIVLLYREGVAETTDFTPANQFFKLPETITLGACSRVALDSMENIYLFHRGKQPIICVDRNGKFLRSWGDDTIDTAHGLNIDRDDNVFVTDISNHQVFKFSPKGKLLLTLGKTGTAGDGVDEFNKPTDVAFGPQGEIYVSDGYGNSRVMKFTPIGGFLAQWGEPGNGPGQFDLPHTIVTDNKNRVVVGDRENDRIQVFDEHGKLLEIWTGSAPFGLAYDQTRNLFVADGRANKVLQIDAKGKVVGPWGAEGAKPVYFQLPLGKIGGKPLWIQDDETPNCDCGSKMKFVALFEEHAGGGINFCGGGKGYAFTCRNCHDQA